MSLNTRFHIPGSSSGLSGNGRGNLLLSRLWSGLDHQCCPWYPGPAREERGYHLLHRGTPGLGGDSGSSHGFCNCFGHNKRPEVLDGISTDTLHI